MENYLTTFTWLMFFATMFLAYYFNLKFRNKERMAFAEKNENFLELTHRKPTPWYVIGFSGLGIGIGIVTGFYIGYILQDDDAMGILMFSLPVPLGAIGIIIGYAVEKKFK